MKRMKKLSALVLSLAMSAALTVPAFAATYSYVERVDIKIDHTIEAGSDEWEFEVDTTTSHVYIEEEDVTVTNAPDEYEPWEEDVRPKAKIIVRLDDDEEWRFKGVDEEDVNITLSGPEGTGIYKYTVSGASGTKTGKKLTIEVTLNKLEYEEGYWDERLEVEDLEWNEETGVAYWAENEYADSYEVRLYRNSTGVTKIIKTTETEYDFSQYFTRAGEYTFKVKGVYDGNKPSEWEESDELDVDKEEAEDIYANWDGTTSSGSSSNNSSSNNSSSNNTAGIQGSEEGAWLRDDIGWWWCNADRTYPSSTWKKISNKWYYFNDRGYCVQNQWVLTNGLYYYCGPDGDMWVSRWTPDNYWVNADGVWVQ